MVLGEYKFCMELQAAKGVAEFERLIVIVVNKPLDERNANLFIKTEHFTHHPYTKRFVGIV